MIKSKIFQICKHIFKILSDFDKLIVWTDTRMRWSGDTCSGEFKIDIDFIIYLHRIKITLKRDNELKQ